MKIKKPGIFIRLVAWITNGKVVALEDFQKQSRYSIVYVDNFYNLYCHVYWSTKVGYCILLDNGIVDPKSPSCYITKWVFYE